MTPQPGPSTSASLRDQRVDYCLQASALAPLDSAPLDVWESWLAVVTSDTRIAEPGAMVLATVNANGQPHTRIVLCKGVDAAGWRFYTNLESRKGLDIAANPHVSLTFPWHAIERQVTVVGIAERVPAVEADEYFASRPRTSQLGAHASNQSQPIGSRAEFLAQYAAADQTFTGRHVPRPDNWGGYVVHPTEIEFWHGDTGRMHHRTLFSAKIPGADLADASSWEASILQS